MPADLQGLVAAITGASAGIGRASAEHLAREGAAVALAARRRDQLEEAARAITAGGGRALAVVADVTQETDVQTFVVRTVETFGRLDVMVCNAGIGFHGSIDETPPDAMRRLLDVNYMGTYYAVRAALPFFKRQGRGHLVIVSSIVGRRGIPCLDAYAATKFAQVGLAESLRAELLGSGIHVTVVCPAVVETEFFDSIKRNFGYAVRGRGPRQSADEVARAIVRCVKRPQPEVYPYPAARTLVILNALAPGLCDKYVRKYRRKEER